MLFLNNIIIKYLIETPNFINVISKYLSMAAPNDKKKHILYKKTKKLSQNKNFG